MSKRQLVPASERWLQLRHLVDGLVTEFVSRKDYFQATGYQYRRIIHRFFDWAEPRGETSPIAYRDHLISQGRNRRYVSMQFSVLRSFWEFLMIQKDAQGNPLATVNPFRTVSVRYRSSSPQRTGLSMPQVRRLLAVLPAQPARARAVVELMLRTGIRVQALVSANREDIDTDTDPPRLYVRHKGKDTKEDFVFLFPTAYEAVMAWAMQRPGIGQDPGLFTRAIFPWTRVSYNTIHDDVMRVFRAAEIDNKTPHDLRHTAITLARQAGVPLDAVGEMAGHADPKTTKGYDHSIQRLENPAEGAIEELLAKEKGEGNGREG